MKAIQIRQASQLKEFLKDLFSSQRLAVLATQSQRQPYCSLVAFTGTADLKHLVFATTRATRKYANISKNPRVAMLIDNRSNRQADFHQAAAVTATGVVEEVEGSEKRRLLKLYLSGHPYLKDFVSSPTCALLRMDVESYYLVRQFQNVVAFHMRK